MQSVNLIQLTESILNTSLTTLQNIVLSLYSTDRLTTCIENVLTAIINHIQDLNAETIYTDTMSVTPVTSDDYGLVFFPTGTAFLHD